MNNKTSFLRNAVTTVLLFVFFSVSLFSQENGEKVSNILTKAYEVIATNPQEAIALFEQASKLQPSDVTIQKQLGYLYIQEGNPDKALEKFIAVEKVAPTDTNKLQIAYLLNSLNRNDEALIYFRQCIESNDEEIQEKSRTAILILEEGTHGQKFPWWGSVYAAPYYDSRFKAGIGLLQVHEGYYLQDDKSLSLYGSLRISGDTKSRGATSVKPSELFSDNALILGLGLKVSPFYGFMTEIQGGVGIDLINKGADKRIKEDFRAVVTYGNGIYPLLAVPSKIKFTFKPLADVYTSFGYYSRYQNGIAYGAGRVGARFIEWKTSALDVYGRLDAVRDTRRKYYNNIVEWGGGIRIIPDLSFGLSILAEYHRGRYFPVTNSTMTPDLFYNSFRFFLIFERAL
jgi:tetratricopeptide (TPR) repeat protein